MKDCKQLILKMKNKLLDTGFFHVFGSSIINQIIAFFSGVILVRVLSKTEYGVYSYAYSIINFFLIFNGVGAASGLIQLSSETSDKKIQRDYYKLANRMAFFFDVFLLAILVVVCRFVAFKLAGTQEVLLVMVPLPICILAYNLKTTYFRATLRTKEYSYANTGNAIAVFVFSVIGAFLFKAKGLAIGQSIAYMASVLCISKFLGLKLSFKKPSISKTQKVDFIKISLISAATSGMSQIMNMLDVFILGIVMPDGDIVASYKVGTTIPTALAFIPAAIVTYIYPYFARNKDNKQWLKIQYKRLLVMVGALNATISIGLLLFAPLIIRIVFGAKYLDSVAVFRILSVSYFFSATFSGMSGNLLVTQRRLKWNFWRGLLTGILNAIGNVILISAFGAVGAAISTLTVCTISGIADTIKMCSVIKHKTE